MRGISANVVNSGKIYFGTEEALSIFRSEVYMTWQTKLKSSVSLQSHTAKTSRIKKECFYIVYDIVIVLFPTC